MSDVLCLILGGGRGKHLYPLTKIRSEPAVPIAGKYRLIDIPISNCLNSGLTRIYVLTQYQSVSLHRHISDSYKFDPFGRGFVAILAAQQTNESENWYLGTADAIRQNLRYVQDDSCRDVLILSGDQLYRMDLRRLVETHRQSQADVTMGVSQVTTRQANRMGIVRLDEVDRVVGFIEKPQTQAELAAFALEAPTSGSGQTGEDRCFLANMGIYCLKRSVLIGLLREFPGPDLVTDMFIHSLAARRYQAYRHREYWEDLGSIRSFHEANLALAGPNPPFDFHTPDGVIYTRARYLPASRVSGAHVKDSLISDGCVVQAGTCLERCSIGVRSKIGRDATLRDTVLLGSDRFETEYERRRDRERGIPPFGVGDRCIIERAILDRDCRLGNDVQILTRGRSTNANGPNFVIRDGIVVIPHRAIVADGSVI